jgi:hypothetical protein
MPNPFSPIIPHLCEILREHHFSCLVWRGGLFGVPEAKEFGRFIGKEGDLSEEHAAGDRVFDSGIHVTQVVFSKGPPSSQEAIT